MATPIELTPAQHAVLAYAIHHAQGRVEWFPKNILGGARLKVLEGLASRALITQEDDIWYVTSYGYEVMGRQHLEPVLEETRDSPEAAATEEGPAPLNENPDAKPLARLGSKRARLLEVLQSPLGATLGQMMLLTGWQAHSVRGQLAHLKKAGMDVTSVKENGERVYRV